MNSCYAHEHPYPDQKCPNRNSPKAENPRGPKGHVTFGLYQKYSGCGYQQADIGRNGGAPSQVACSNNDRGNCRYYQGRQRLALIVVDASIMCDFLLDAEENPEMVNFLATQSLAAPSLIEYEIGHTLRRLNLVGKLSDQRAKSTIESFALLRIELHFAVSLMSRAWELRQNITFYDASYVALAELLELPLYTRDKRLAAAPGHLATIILI